MYLCSGKIISAIIPHRWCPANVSLLDLRVSSPPCKKSVFHSYCTLFLVSSHFSRENITTTTLSCTYALRKLNPKLWLEGNESRIRTKAVQINAAVISKFFDVTLRKLRRDQSEDVWKRRLFFSKSHISLTEQTTTCITNETSRKARHGPWFHCNTLNKAVSSWEESHCFHICTIPPRDRIKQLSRPSSFT